MIYTPHRGSSPICARLSCHPCMQWALLFDFELSIPSNFLFFSFSFNLLQSFLHFFHNLEGSRNTAYFAEKEMESYDESITESLTQPQFSEQRFLEDVDYDDTALDEMLHNAHRVHVYHSQREGVSVGQSSSSVSERTGRPVVERTGRPVVASGQELNVGNAQIRTLLDRQKEQILAECQVEIKKHEFQDNYDRRSVQKLSEIIESQQEIISLCSSRRTSTTRSTTSSCTVITAKFGITWSS